MKTAVRCTIMWPARWWSPQHDLPTQYVGVAKIQLQPAPWPQRILAKLLDMVFLGAVLSLVMLVFNQTTNLLPALVLVDMAYGVLAVKWFHGSPAKRILGLKLLTLKGEPIGYLSTMARHYPMAAVFVLLGLFWVSSKLAHPLDHSMALAGDTALSLLFILGLSNHGAAWFNPHRRALHDYLAGTVVCQA